MKYFFYSLFLISSFCNAQELVKDINTTPSGQYPYGSQTCFSCGGNLFMVAVDGEHGLELWTSDGTEGGTRLVKDMKEGPENGLSYYPKCANGKLYFGGEGLWRTDGTEGGTQQIVSYRINDYSVLGSKLVFFDTDRALYSVNEDGSDLQILRPSDQDQASPSSPIAAAGKVFFKVDKFSIETYTVVNSELWMYNGSSIEKVFEAEEGDQLQNLTVFHDKLYFATDYFDAQVWVTDGTEEGTIKLLDDANIGNEYQFNLDVNGKLLLKSSSQPNGTWLTDGTPEGTTPVLEEYIAQQGIYFNDEYYFLVETDISDHLPTIIKTDADFQNIQELAPANDYNSNTLLGIVNGKLLYAGSSDDGVELLSTDGTTTSVLKDINPGTASSNPQKFTLNGAIGYFVADDGQHGYEFWKTDGTTGGTSLLKDIFTGTIGTMTQNIYMYGNKVYFPATQNQPYEGGWDLWESDGTSEGTQLLESSAPYYYDFFIGTGKYVVSWGIKKTDLTTGQVSVLKDATAIGHSGSQSILGKQVGDDFYFFHNITSNAVDTGTELWRINAVTNELTLTKDINPGSAGSDPATGGLGWAALGSKLVFAAQSPDGIEPWITDGTEAGTFQLKNIITNGDSYPRGFVAMGNKVYFVARGIDSDDYRRTIWVTDGTPEGTKIVKVLGEKGGVTSNDLGVIGTQLIFGWTPGDTTVELWKSDGTPNGTVSYVLMPQVEYDISNFTAIGNKVIFTTDYNDLWVTDGTSGGTSILDFAHTTTAYPALVTVVDNMAYFLNENKIWRTDAVSVTLIGPAKPVGNFFVNDNYVLFIQDDPQYGRELFRYDLSTITGLGPEEKVTGTVVYPNPTTSTLFVKADSPTALRIVDMSGREKHSQFINNDVSIDVSSYADGMYVVILNNKPFKFIKRH